MSLIQQEKYFSLYDQTFVIEYVLFLRKQQIKEQKI